MEDKNKEKQQIISLEEALKAFWKEYGGGVSVNAKHTYVTVEPKYIIGNRVNNEVARRVIGVYLSQLTSDKIVDEEIMITKDSIKIFDKGRIILEIANQPLVDSINNTITHKVGDELSKREKKAGGSYLQPKPSGKYTFGEIKHALSEFLLDSEKNDSKNLLKDAVLLLFD